MALLEPHVEEVNFPQVTDTISDFVGKSGVVGAGRVEGG